MAFSKVISYFILGMLLLMSIVQIQGIQVASGPVNSTVIIGQNLTLTCEFLKPVGSAFNILWRRSNVDIGRCQMPYDCVNFDASVILKESNRTRFELQVTNVTMSDSGSYECGIENRSSVGLVYTSKKSAFVSVVSESMIANPSCGIEITESAAIGRPLDLPEILTHLICSWPRTYAGASGRFDVEHPSSDQNLPSSVDTVANITSISMEKKLPSLEEDTQCLMTMPGLQSERSCTFSPLPLSPSTVQIAEDESADFTCNSPNSDSLSWFAVINNTMIDIPSTIWISVEHERITIRYAPIKYNNLTLVCASRNENGQLDLLGIGKLFIHQAHFTAAPMQNDKEQILSDDTYVPVNVWHRDHGDTKNGTNKSATSAKHYVTPVSPNPNFNLPFDSLHSWMKYLIYYSAIASSLTLALVLMMVAYFCVVRRRGKSASQEDVEHPPQIAKVVAIPSHTSADYATIDSSELKLKCQKANDAVLPRERKESFRYFQPNKVALMTKDALEVASTSDGSAKPSLPNRRTQSEYRQNNSDDPTYFDTSNSRHLWRNLSLQQPLPVGVGRVGSRLQRSAAIDEESTIDSRASVPKKGEPDEVFYFPLDKVCPGDNELGEIDNKTIKSTVSEETTLGRNEHPYFTLEEAPDGGNLTSITENNNFESKSKITNNNESTYKGDLATDYDNFRSKRIPYLRENSEDHYEKLKCNSKG